VNENTSLIDDARTICLCDVGQPGYIAATAITAEGREHLVLAELDAIGDEHVLYDPTCTDVTHEQLGALPLEFVRRITVSQRVHRCGRPTKTTGRPCRVEVARPGEACGLHRQRPAVARCRWCAVPLQQPDSISRGLCGECRFTAEEGRVS
jgi:hypothetical protein